MKKIILGFVFLILSFGVLANPSTKVTKSTVIENICGDIGAYSEAVMRSRQSGGNITTHIKFLNNQTKISEAKLEYYKSIVYEAYKEPKWATQDNQENAVNEFSNKMYLTCVQIFQKQLSGIE